MDPVTALSHSPVFYPPQLLSLPPSTTTTKRGDNQDVRDTDNIIHGGDDEDIEQESGVASMIPEAHPFDLSCPVSDITISSTIRRRSSLNKHHQSKLKQSEDQQNVPDSRSSLLPVGLPPSSSITSTQSSVDQLSQLKNSQQRLEQDGGSVKGLAVDESGRLKRSVLQKV